MNRSRSSRFALAVAAALALVAWPELPADAQTKTSPRRRGGGTKRRKVIRLGEFRIEGTIQKPQAFYILQRSSLNYESLMLERSFVPKIIESVNLPPF